MHYMHALHVRTRVGLEVVVERDRALVGVGVVVLDKLGDGRLVLDRVGHVTRVALVAVVAQLHVGNFPRVLHALI